MIEQNAEHNNRRVLIKQEVEKVEKNHRCWYAVSAHETTSKQAVDAANTVFEGYTL
jgi:hypothetical protein